MTPPAENGSPKAAADAAPEAAAYEHARDELASVVARLESGGLSLDESLTLWERGEHLAAVCTRFLDGARERVDAAFADRKSRNRTSRKSEIADRRLGPADARRHQAKAKRYVSGIGPNWAIRLSASTNTTCAARVRASASVSMP